MISITMKRPIFCLKIMAPVMNLLLAFVITVSGSSGLVVKHCGGLIDKKQELERCSPAVSGLLNDKDDKDDKASFLNLLRLTQLAKSSEPHAACLSTVICPVIKECEFPVDVVDNVNEFNSQAMAASHLASELTALGFNDKTEILTSSTLVSLLRLNLVDYASIYDSKIALFDSDKQLIHAFKDATSSMIQIKSETRHSLPNTKYNRWYYKWHDEKRASVPSQSTWSYRVSDSRLDLNTLPSASDLNAVRYESRVGYDCSAHTWFKLVSVPILSSNGNIRGVVAVSISLNKFDIKQCRGIDTTTTTNSSFFSNSDRCDQESTQCVDTREGGFSADSYVCECKSGYFRPRNVSSDARFKCSKCPDGCETCQDSYRPCIADVPIHLKKAALVTNIVCIVICLFLVYLAWYHMKLKVYKSSVPMIFIVLLGSIVLYSEIIPMYMRPSYWTCSAAQALQLIGFLLTYGALALKTWGEYKIFYVRTAKSIKSTDLSLIKYLGMIILGGGVFLFVWLLRTEDSPRRDVRFDSTGERYETCTITWWNLLSLIIQLTVLLWGAVVSIQVRRASIAFKETKLITWAIFHEVLVLCLMIVLNYVMKRNRFSCYVPFFVNFVRIHLTITVMLLLVFSYKIYEIIKALRKPMQANQTGVGAGAGLTGAAAIAGEQKSTTINEETDKERELKVEISRLYRQIEEMRSLSMRIANPHLIPKKQHRIVYATKKPKPVKSKLNLENEAASRMYSTYEPEQQSLVVANESPSAIQQSTSQQAQSPTNLKNRLK